jgi:hypothetical protein
MDDIERADGGIEERGGELGGRSLKLKGKVKNGERNV